MKSYQRKAAEARALVAQVKAMHNDTKSAGTSGIDSGEKAEVARKMMADAKRLGTEARAEREADDADRTKSLLEQYESGKNVTGDADLLKSRKTNADDAPIFEEKEVVVMAKALARHLYGAKAAGNLKAFNSKVMLEGDGENGEFLVVPEYHQELFAEQRTTGNALRSLGWVNVHPTRSNKIFIPVGEDATTMAWVGQNQPAPSTDLGTDQIQVDIHKAVGIAKVAFELDSDSDPAATNLALRDLAKRGAILEERTWINGSGSGEGFGVLNTPGVQTKTFGASADTAQEQIDLIFDMAMDILSNYHTAATGVLMAPRRYAFLRKAKDSNNNYLFNAPGSTRAPSAATKSEYDGGELLGLPVGLSANVPTNLGGGSNEDRIIVGDWSELHCFIRLDNTIDFNDRSDTAWANDQVQVRLKFRQGSTAERYPLAFSVGGGAGLAV